ncbi:hypothetical protein Moror_4998 [Moniliophthora roreri MCA 2997]|uniref:Uncharacterized protein n=2 Tax=Moniliophthora roreri TaxID=221103 RepID=V2WXS3_MONRO|nr:hypothetical protein Moror_4998 [Moniliophthora roreri MCA 2997]
MSYIWCNWSLKFHDQVSSPVYGESNQLSALCAHTPLFFPTMLHAAIVLAERGNPWFELFISSLLQIGQEDDEEHLISDVKELCSRYDIPALALRLLIEENGKAECDIYVLHASVQLFHLAVTRATDRNPGPTYRTLLLKNLVKWLVRTMSYISSHLHTMLTTDNWQRAFETLRGCAYHVRFCTTYLGHACVTDALDCQLLVTMVKTAYLPFQSDRIPGSEVTILTDQYSSLLTALLPFLVFRSVVYRILKQLERVRSIRIPNVLTNDPFRDALKQINELAHNYRTSIRKFDEERPCLNALVRGVPIKLCQIERPSVALSVKSRYTVPVSANAWTGSSVTERDANRFHSCCLGFPNPVTELDLAFIKAHVRLTTLESQRGDILHAMMDKRTREKAIGTGILLEFGAVEFPFCFELKPLPLWLDDHPGDEWREKRQEAIAALSTIKPDKELLIVVNYPDLTHHGMLIYKEAFDSRIVGKTTL